MSSHTRCFDAAQDNDDDVWEDQEDAWKVFPLWG